MSSVEPDRLAREITTVFALFDELVRSTMEFHTYLTQVLAPFDLDRGEFLAFKGSHRLPTALRRRDLAAHAAGRRHATDADPAGAVSYTHLDVYKRQALRSAAPGLHRGTSLTHP